MRIGMFLRCVFSIGVIAMSSIGSGGIEPENQDAQRQRLRKTLGAGHFKDAYEGLRELALNPNDDPAWVGEDLRLAIQALQRLNRVNEIDALREKVISVHQKHWRVLWTAAQTYVQVPHQGVII